MVVEGIIASVAKFCVVSATLTAGICCYAQVFGKVTRLLDQPDGIRKIHSTATPLIGGLAVLVPSFAISLLYLAQVDIASPIVGAIIASAVMLVVGVADDRHDLPPTWRLVAFIAITFGLLIAEPIFVLNTLRFGTGPGSVTVPLGVFAIPATGLMIVGFLNASNMADGMNGQLLGSIVIWCLFVAWHLGFEAGIPFLAVMASAMAALMFNLRGKLFSGSAGAYAGTFLVGVGAIGAYRMSDGQMPASLPALWFWLPVLDCVRLLVTRAMEGGSPFEADRRHFHHLLLKRLPPRGALTVYLALLAAPGAAAELNLGLGAAALGLSILAYAGIVIAMEVRQAPDATAETEQRGIEGALT